MIPLKQSTASQEVPLGYFLDSTDGDSEETGLTISNTDIKLWKSGATTLANKNSGGATHISNGIYYATLDATDTDTVGPLVIFCHESGALSVRVECIVFEEDIYDALYGSGANAFDSNGRVDVAKWLGTACATPTTAGVPEVDVTHVAGSAEDIATETKQDTIDTVVDGIAAALGVMTDAAAAGDPTTGDTAMAYIKQLINILIGTSGIGTFPAEAAPANAVSLAEVIRAIHTDVTGLNGDSMRGTDNAALASVCTAARLGELDAANIPADLDAVKADTASLDDTKIPDTLSLANINTQCDTAITDHGLDHLVSAAVTGSDVADNSALAKLVSSSATADWDDFNNETDSLQAVRDRGDTAWTTGGGGSLNDILAVSWIIPISIDLADTSTVRIGIHLINCVDNLPSTAEITPGTISIDRKAIGGTSWTSVVADAAMSESAGQIYYDEVFDSGTGYAAGDSIRVTFKSQKITVDANDFDITDSTGVMFQTSIREAMRGTDSASTVTTAQVNSEVDTALADIGLDHLVSAAVTGTDVADDSIVAQLVSDGATADYDDYDNTAHSLNAIRVRGDAAWTTGGGGSISDILNIQPIIPQPDLADGVSERIGFMLFNSLDDLPSTAEITPGTIKIERRPYGQSTWTTIVNDEAMLEAEGVIYYDEVFNISSGYACGDTLRFTFKGQKITVSANDYEITSSAGVAFPSCIREAIGSISNSSWRTPPN